jgi:hypothetical protein
VIEAVELISLLRHRGVQLVVVGENLHYCPASAVTPELRAELVAHKTEVVRLLRYRAAAHEYDYLGAQIDVLIEQAVQAREQGDDERARRLAAEARALVEGPYWRAGQQLAALADDEDAPLLSLTLPGRPRLPGQPRPSAKSQGQRKAVGNSACQTSPRCTSQSPLLPNVPHDIDL